MLDDIRALPTSLDLPPGLVQYLEDVILISSDSETYLRPWDGVGADKSPSRQARRLKAEMLLLLSGEAWIATPTLDTEIKPSGAEPMSAAAFDLLSPSGSNASLMPGDTEASTEDEREAMTPDLVASLSLEPTDAKKGDEPYSTASPLL